MRCFQPQGLSSKAHKFLDEKIKEAGEKLVKIDFYDSKDYFYGSEYDFNIWKFPDGTIIKEIEQACPWSSGPMLFTCLEDKDGVLIHEWDEEEIEGML